MTTNGSLVLSVLATVVLLVRCSPSHPPGTVDVVEGESVLLECRFDPSRITPNIVYYWFRKNQKSTDNAALGNEALDPHYTVEFEPSKGRYDLHISRAQYDLDNGQFQCRLREKGSGLVVFAQAYDVTVLIAPGEPQVTPNNPNAREGEPFALTCSSQGGSPDPQIQWYRQGVPQQGQLQKGGSRDRPTSSVLALTPKMEDDTATYRCTVYNRAIPENRRLESSVALRVHYSPRLTVGPFNPLKVLTDSDVTLTCGIKASPPVRSVRWMKSGMILSNTPNHTLPMVTPKDSGIYTCVAENGIGEPTQVNLELVVLYGPEVNLVAEQEVTAGHSLSVKCNVAASPPPYSVQWKKDDDPYFRQNGDTLTLEKLSADDAGRYSCVASNILQPSGSLLQREVAGNASVTIHVTHKPGEAQIHPNNPVAIAGRPFTLSCSAQPPGWPHPEFRWWREGQENIELARRTNYTLISAHVSHEGRYFCQPHNALGEGNLASVYLTVNEPATISIPLRPQIVKKEGDRNFSLTCRARGKPKPQVKWLHNQEPVVLTDQQGRHSVTVTDNIEDNNAYSVQSTLNFDGAARRGNTLDPSDRGQYSCVFDNGVGKPAAAHTVVHIEHSPVVRHTYNRVAFDVGETAVLVCKMQAYPEPNFEWFYQSRSLEYMGVYQTNVTSLGNDLFAGALAIKDISESDYGDYTCRAWNLIGDDEKTIIKLVKKGAPDAPSHVTPVNINSNTVTLQWVHGFNGGYANTEFLVNVFDTTNGMVRNESCRTQNPCQVTGLTSNTKYKFKVLAVNTRGHSTYSEEITISSKVNLKDMPRVNAAHYDKDSHVVTFQVMPTNLKLFAKIEARPSDVEDWKQVAQVDEVAPNVNKVPLRAPTNAQAYSDVRVVLCLWSNESWCGDGRIASPDEEQPFPKEARPQFLKENLMTIIIIVVIVGVAFFIAVVVVICCCWCRKGKKESLGKKDYEMQASNTRPPVAVAPPPYYSDGVMNKGLENNINMHEDLAKHGIYTTGLPNSHITNNVHNGMLYGGDHDSSQCGPNDSQSDLWLKTDADVPPAPPANSSYKPYDNGMSNGYFYPDDYQPLTDEVMNMKNRDHLHSPYYDVSGLPDPYAMGDDEKAQQVSFDESLESGYSTPNSRSRRVIREIIV